MTVVKLRQFTYKKWRHHLFWRMVNGVLFTRIMTVKNVSNQ
jgi:hypothetical protein